MGFKRPEVRIFSPRRENPRSFKAPRVFLRPFGYRNQRKNAPFARCDLVKSIVSCPIP
nr:MAG TPA: hypothetical protein [Caudoviricetes sp.]